MATLSGTLTENLRLYSQDSYIIAHAMLLAELVRVSNVTTRKTRFNVPLSDRVDLESVASIQARYGITLFSGAVVETLARVGIGATLREALTLRGRLTPTQATQIRESLRVVLQTELAAVYKVAVRQGLAISAHELRHAIGGILTARLAINHNLTRVYRAVNHVADMVGVSDVIHPQLMIVVLSHDDIELSEQQLLRGIYKGTLQDTIDFLIDIVEPSGDTTTWAMNVRTGAVTEYLDYNFNSFAKGPSGVYLGASRDGLYELTGADDAGNPVVADLVSGLVDAGGAFLSGFRAAYLAIRGEGQFYLRLTTGTGQTYTYGVQASSLKTTRVDMGKGLRARYFTFELISTGQDFDMLDLTFLPITMTRRV